MILKKKYLLPERQGFIIVPTSPSFGVTLPYHRGMNFSEDEDCFDWADADLLMGRYELEQYTGLRDKNDKEIYEGDIVKCYSTANEPCLAVVEYGRMPDICGHEYCPCRIGFYLDDKVYFDEDFGEDDDHGDLEVVGNIHENPELLEDGK